MTSVAAHDDQVGLKVCRLGVYLHLRFAEDDMLMLRINIVCFRQSQHLLASLLVYLFLYSREIHRNITAIGKAEWLDNMNQM